MCHHNDVQVVRHVSRALAELAMISVRPGLANVGDSQAAFTPNSNRSSLMMPTTGGGLGMSSRSGIGSVASVSMSVILEPLSKPMGLWSRSSRKMLAGGGPSSMQSATKPEDKRALPNICQETEEIGWLLKLAAHDDLVIRRAAAQIFDRLGKKASGWLLRAEQDSDGEVMDAIMELGNHEDEQIRRHALRALASITQLGHWVPIVIQHPEFGRVALSTRSTEELRVSASILKNLSQAGIAEVDGQDVVADMLSAALHVLRTDDDQAIVEISCFIARLCESQLPAVIVDVERLRDVCVALLQMCTAAHLQAHLSERNDELQMTNATQALAAIATEATGCKMLTELGANKVLIRVLKASKSEPTKAAVISAMELLDADGADGVDPMDPRASDSLAVDAHRRVSAGGAAEGTADHANIPANLVVDESQVRFSSLFAHMLLSQLSLSLFGWLTNGGV